MDGFYVGYFTGAVGNSLGMFVFRQGAIVGVDAAGTRFDGVFRADEKICALKLEVKIPAGGQTIQGVSAGNEELTYQVETSLPIDMSHVPYFTIPTPFGKVNVRLKKVRDL